MNAINIIVIVLLLILAFAYSWYVKLIKYRNKAREALSSIDVQLRKRHDLLPNILRLAQQFMAHERSLLSEITALRSSLAKPYDPNDSQALREHFKAEGQLQNSLRQLFAVAENYPELKSSDTIIQAQQTYNQVEGHIGAARRFYNASVNELNNAVEIFPGSMIAQMANVQTMPFFEIEDESVRAPVNVNDYLNS